MYKPKYFKTQELVSSKVYADRGEKALQLFDERALKVIDLLRVQFGSATINDWLWGGENESRGLRTPDSPYYRSYSQHTFGRAFDVIFKDATAKEVRDWIREKGDYLLEEIGAESITLESGVSWLHFDLRQQPKPGVWEFAV